MIACFVLLGAPVASLLRQALPQSGRLFIALATVKKHLANIFGKLGVTNRVQALKRAQELGLI